MGCFITILVQHKKNNQTGDNGKKNLLWGQGNVWNRILSNSKKVGLPLMYFIKGTTGV